MLIEEKLLKAAVVSRLSWVFLHTVKYLSFYKVVLLMKLLNILPAVFATWNKSYLPLFSKAFSLFF